MVVEANARVMRAKSSSAFSLASALWLERKDQARRNLRRMLHREMERGYVGHSHDPTRSKNVKSMSLAQERTEHDAMWLQCHVTHVTEACLSAMCLLILSAIKHRQLLKPLRRAPRWILEITVRAV